MVGAAGAIFAQAAAELAHGQQAHLGAVGQALQAGRERGQSGGQLAEHLEWRIGLVDVGVVSALGELKHRRAGATADQAQGQGHLLAKTAAGDLQPWWQGRQLPRRR